MLVNLKKICITPKKLKIYFLFYYLKKYLEKNSFQNKLKNVNFEKS